MTPCERKSLDAVVVRWAIIENIFIIVGTVALVLGLWAMGAGGWSLWGLLLLTNMNSF